MHTKVQTNIRLRKAKTVKQNEKVRILIIMKGRNICTVPVYSHGFHEE